MDNGFEEFEKYIELTIKDVTEKVEKQAKLLTIMTDTLRDLKHVQKQLKNFPFPTSWP